MYYSRCAVMKFECSFRPCRDDEVCVAIARDPATMVLARLAMTSTASSIPTDHVNLLSTIFYITLASSESLLKSQIKLKRLTQLFLVLFSIISAITMTSIFQRLTRPFTSSTLRFAPDTPAGAMSIPEGAQKATVAAGCFWGVEHMYRKDFGKQGLIDARVGYIGGDTDNPSYRAVCSGRTGRKWDVTDC